MSIINHSFVRFFWSAVILFPLFLLCVSCSVNPATGENQFTALLPPQQEESVGAREHQKIQELYGDFVEGPVAEYVRTVGKKVAANTERQDVQYKFFVIDSGIVNAFALPGGYVYLSRGLLALANNEDELAAVMGHEIGHITGRHAAARTSQGALVGIGAAILSAATGNQAIIGQIANVGSDLYIKSYSRGQENEADELGVRYIVRAGYDPQAMTSFLKSLEANDHLERAVNGRQSAQKLSYFSTHPLTEERIRLSSLHAQNALAQKPDGKTQPHAEENRSRYLSAINGLVYGDSERQGFIRDGRFYHPKLGFTFDIPDGFSIQNSPSEIVATNREGAVFIFDSAQDDQGRDPFSYMAEVWMKGATESPIPEPITINGMKAATTAFAGKLENGQAVTIRIVAIEWQKGRFFRFQIALPEGASVQTADRLKQSALSFRSMSASEQKSVQPLRIRLVTARASDSPETLAKKMETHNYPLERFMVLNAIPSNGQITPQRLYKLVSP